jgi:hypothetical protein
MAGHRYWRVNVAAVNGGGSNIVLSGVEMFAASGGANQVVGCGASNMIFNAPAYQAFDGIATSPWNANALPAWLGWYFGAQGAQVVYEFEVTSLSGGVGDDFAPTAFTLEYSDDGSSWTVGATFSGVTWTGGGQSQVFATGVASAHLYWRINCSASVFGSTVEIGGLDMHATSGGPSIITGVASASSVGTGTGGAASAANPTNAAMFTNLSSDGCGWVSASSVTAASWTYDFGAGSTPAIVQVALTNSNNSGSGQYTNTSPTAFTVDYSDDDTNWFTAAAFSGVSWSSPDQTQTFSLSGSQSFLAAGLI